MVCQMWDCNRNHFYSLPMQSSNEYTGCHFDYSLSKKRHSQASEDKCGKTRPKKQLRCRECSAHTSFKCSNCGNLERPVPLCRLITGRNCWDTFDQRRISDLSSSRSTGLSSQGDSQIRQYLKIDLLTQFSATGTIRNTPCQVQTGLITSRMHLFLTS